MPCELANTSESRHKCITVNHIHFPSMDIGAVFMKGMFLYNDLCPHQLCLSMALENIFRQETHSTPNTRMPGGRRQGIMTYYKQLILDNTRDLFNQIFPGSDVWSLCKNANMVYASAVAVRNKSFEIYCFFQVDFCNGRENIRESGNQITFCSSLLTTLKRIQRLFY